MERIAAVVVMTILGGVAALQLALALGAPWGVHSYGGRAAAPGEPLPGRYRVASLVAVPLLLAAGWVVLARAGVVGSGPAGSTLLHRGTWVVAAYLAVNTLANLASTSRVERYVLAAATATAAVLTVLVARS